MHELVHERRRAEDGPVADDDMARHLLAEAPSRIPRWSLDRTSPRLDAWAKDARIILGRELRHTIEKISPEAAKPKPMSMEVPLPPPEEMPPPPPEA